jgi:hypothetical protein
MHTAISLTVASLHAGKLRGFATVFAEPAGLWHLGHIAGEYHCYNSPKNRLFKATIWQVRAAKLR